ncbi:hypothetical protein AOQ73_36520 [Bradyrhizobium pachyrhizi]|uniref:hypothetical protein n=1 Tax=Bradyrhizobium pachyrhizi TaxID=280333 RepID=UPI0007152E56|nr:hypothetical protein [Bradyrhizobium pachyrhizi]KRP85982.1 hypothetical protein AOQ73_36520 [Bradyrhizobium pachyrhizi]
MRNARPSDDPAVVALNRVLAAGDDDEEYNVAIAGLETCIALTAQGVRAKRNLERSRQAALEQGDRLTFDGRIMMQRLADTIDEGLSLLTREVQRRAPRRLTAEEGHPTPRHPPTPRGPTAADRSD